MSIHYKEMDLRNKTTSEFRTVFDSPLGVPNFQVPLYVPLPGALTIRPPDRVANGQCNLTHNW